MRTALGFILAPLAPALLAAAILPMTEPSAPITKFFTFATLFSPLFALPATVFFAIPLYVWFRRRRLLRFQHAMIGGAIVGIATALVLTFYGFVTAPNAWSEGHFFVHWAKEFLICVILFAPYSLAMAWIFWIVTYWKRKPNNTVERDASQAARPSR